MRKIEDVTLKDGRRLKEVLKLHKKWLEGLEGSDRADLSYEDLSYVDLKDIDLRCVILRGVNLSYANLKGVNLKYANLIDVDLRGVYLEDANLKYANLIDANLRGSNLKGVNLKYANLIDVDLRGANLKGVNLKYANLSNANLTGVNLIDANLSYANLSYTDLIDADLTGVNLIGANLTRANLTDANLIDVKYNNTTSFFSLQCPEEGSFIGYKKANDKIVKLLITEDAKRSSATTRKCRCNKAKVLSITSLDGKESFKKVASDYNINFVYEVGKIVEVENFDNDRWNECSSGIHFFITRDEAVMY